MSFQPRAKVRVLLIYVMYNDRLFNTERYFLLFWPEEDKVSIHKEDELKSQDCHDSLIVGGNASCRFGKIYYEGRIAGIGKKYRRRGKICWAKLRRFTVFRSTASNLLSDVI